MAMNRKVATGLFTFIGLAIGFGIGWMVFGMNKNGSIAGKDCTLADGVTKGKTDNAGVCKA